MSGSTARLRQPTLKHMVDLSVKGPVLFGGDLDKPGVKLGRHSERIRLSGTLGRLAGLHRRRV